MSPPTPGERNSPYSTRTATSAPFLPSDEYVFMYRQDSPQTATNWYACVIEHFPTACVPPTMGMHRRDAPKRSAQLW